jgi:hypothetical protein
MHIPSTRSGASSFIENPSCFLIQLELFKINLAFLEEPGGRSSPVQGSYLNRAITHLPSLEAQTKLI